jgi:PAS domain S-box-containing protein
MTQKESGRHRKQSSRPERAVDVAAAQSAMAKAHHELKVHQIELEMQNDELRLTRQELESSRARYFDLYNLAPVGYCTIDKQGLILEANLTAARQLGVERGVLVQQPISRFIFSEDQDVYTNSCRELFATGTAQTCEVRVQPLAGAPYWARMEGNIARAGDGSLSYRLVISDITEHKQLEAEVVKARNLKSLGILAGGIAHDFNNLLQGLFGNIELAMMDIEKSSTAYPFLVNATHLFKLASKLTAQLIAFSSGGISSLINIAPTDYVREEMATALVGSGLRVDFDLAADLWLIKVDPFQFHQVIKQIVCNAKEAMASHPGGTLRVKAVNEPVAEMSATTKNLVPGNYVRFSIADQGPGISREHLPRIFDPYFSTKQRGSEKGMGLGLALCDAIIRKHGGAITVQSKLGTGTTFHIHIPAAAALTPAQKELAALGPRILALDDDPVAAPVTNARKQSACQGGADPDGDVETVTCGGTVKCGTTP